MTTLPEITTATNQLAEIQEAIAGGNYTALQSLLLSQTLILHKIGVDFLEKSNEVQKLKLKTACIDIALRAMGRSQKAMASIKSLERQ